ncbi:MAG: SDR family oxidoreductase [Pseudomonadota bacterium]
MKPELRDLSGLFSLEGKVALVTGGAGILGRHFCLGLAQYGATVVCGDLDLESAEEFCAEANSQFGVTIEPLALDVAAPNSVAKAISSIVEKHGQIDILHNNAAAKSSDLAKFFTAFEEYDLNTWREIMSVNVDGMFLVAQAVGRQMVKQKTGGAIVQTASIYGLSAPDNRIYEGSEYNGMKINTPAVYAASKAAVIGLTGYLSTYWAKQNIRVNTIVPGGVESGQNDVFKGNYSKRVPLGRMAHAHEMVGALIFLSSDAASYVTGQNITVDGGLTAW